jgi:formylglycine-generating enzyme required for sulfatase activity
VSGAAHSFASSATYTVTAGDSTTQDWVVTLTPRTVGQVDTFTDGVTPFKMMYVPGGVTFPTGTDDLGTPATVAAAYWIGETAVTYELWHKVYLWATTDAGGGLRADGGVLYHFQNAGGDSGQQPVNDINPRDMIVFSNAITEWYNANNGTDQDYVCVYKDSGVPIRDSRDANGAQCDAVVQDTSANGFRLLTSNEWELAARWRNDSTNTVAGYTNPYFTKGNSASGATKDYTDGTETALYAVYGTGTTPSVVKTKLPNALGLYDMSGNVNNLDFNYIPSTTNRSVRGGSCGMGAIATQVGSSTGSSGPSGYAYWIGLRLSRTDL